MSIDHGLPVALVGVLDGREPDGELAGLLDAIDPRSLSGEDLAAYVRARWRVHNRAEASLLAGLRELGMAEQESSGRSGRRAGCDEFSGDEAAALFGWSRTMASRRLDLADAVFSRLPGLGAALWSGRLDEPKVRAMCESVADLCDDHARQAVAMVLPEAAGLPVMALRERLAEVALDLDPDWAARRRRRAEARGRVLLSASPEGTATLALVDAPASAGIASMSRIEALAGAVRGLGVLLPINLVRLRVGTRLLDGSTAGMTDDEIARLLAAEYHATTETTQTTDADDEGPDDEGPDDEGPDDEGPDDEGPDDGPDDKGPDDGPNDSGPNDSGPNDSGPNNGPNNGGPDSGPNNGSGSDGSGSDGSGSDDGGPDNGGPDNGGPDSGPNDGSGSDDGGPSDGGPDDGGPDHGGPDHGGPDDGGLDSGPSEGSEPGSSEPGLPEPGLPGLAVDPEPSGVLGPRAGCRRRGIVEVRLRLSTALGLDEHPATVPGYGAVSAAVARDLLTALTAAPRGEWRVVLTDPEGHLQHVLLARHRPHPPPGQPPGQPPGVRGPTPGAVRAGTIVELQIPTSRLRALHPDEHPGWTSLLHELQARLQQLQDSGTLGCPPDPEAGPAWWRRRAGAEADRWTRARDRHCVAPRCAQPAHRAEIDHTRQHAHGGPSPLWRTPT